MYYSEQEKYNNGEDGTSFYSETLKNAICAIGANLTPKSRQGLLESDPELFSSRAKTLLEIEMDSPSVATVQALVIMSASEAAFTRDARGWIYSGMAVRISADLGLHLDLSRHVQDGQLTSHELDVRRTTFWGVFIHDNMWSLYVGRPWGINIRDISISRPPTGLDRVRNKIWKPYYDEMDAADSENEKPGLYDPVEACADSNVSLCAMMRRLSRILGRDLSDAELRDFASDMRREFAQWHESLPEELAVDLLNDEKMYLPHVLQLHLNLPP
ncbi:putative Nitrogen assimilation transcription factor nit-4 [Glarea lozoyensis 74030]|uniref:Putative Nitrogen assimilation transcription factor nit-4 n=1 Tax=Glarea lozoyensis (strain ATCC 74030 / MF5533) TaxID=1104152 RepID=H0EPV2_GLAL7|nr:putative Nitrogen assimilation transcription factor nit-4 [Glarea lozoyensis 74030]